MSVGDNPDRSEGRWLQLAAAIVARADREHPADAVLRDALRDEPGLTPADSRWVSRAVFAYHRWLGWLAEGASVTVRIGQALELAERWEQSARGFSEEELEVRSLPAWARGGGSVGVGPEAAGELGGWRGVSGGGSFWGDWLRALQSEPAVWIRARLGEGASLSRELGHCTAAGAGRLGDALRYTGTTDLFRTSAFAQGQFEIQDVHSQAVGWLCDPQPGETWWDTCAGEGGKLLHLADMMANRGLIWASDRARWRLDRLKMRAARAGVFNYRMRSWSGGQSLPMATRCDGVLVDAPCSNLGTWQRNPQARWTTTPVDVAELAAVQTQLLGTVVPALKPGGRLFYAVCTLTRAETVGVARAIGQRHPELEPLPLADPWDAGGVPRPVPWLWLAPRPGGGNGMFIAAWRRRLGCVGVVVQP
jgi:16S rRNA (cytosine967-C5)-methyltransferase